MITSDEHIFVHKLEWRNGMSHHYRMMNVGSSDTIQWQPILLVNFFSEKSLQGIDDSHALISLCIFYYKIDQENPKLMDYNNTDPDHRWTHACSTLFVCRLSSGNHEVRTHRTHLLVSPKSKYNHNNHSNQHCKLVYRKIIDAYHLKWFQLMTKRPQSIHQNKAKNFILFGTFAHFSVTSLASYASGNEPKIPKIENGKVPSEAN